VNMAKSEKSEKKTTPIPKNLEELQKGIEKEFGSGAVMRGRGSVVKVDVFPTDVASIDIALGCGGLPQGRIIEVYGAESSGKTTTCLQFIAACQQHEFAAKSRKGVAAFVDAEHALDPTWAGKVGVNMSDLLVSQPDSGEEALMIVERIVDSGLIDLIVVDSVAALTPKAVLDGEVGDSTMAALAQLMSKAMNRLKGKCNRTKTTVIFINQVREKVGIVFGNPELTPGGRALKFYASVRAEVKKGSPIKHGDVIVGFRPSIKIVKNKVAPPFMIGEFDICVGMKERPVFGIDTVASLLEVASTQKIVSRNGSFYVYGDQRLGNGLANALSTLRSNPKIVDELKTKIYDGICSHNVVEDECDENDSFDVTDDISDTTEAEL